MTEENKVILDTDKLPNFADTFIDINTYRRLEQENKELKETIKQYCQWLDEEREDNDKLQKVYQNDHCDLLNYRSALEKIKEPITRLRDNNYQSMEELEDDINFIQDKINEVLK